MPVPAPLDLPLEPADLPDDLRIFFSASKTSERQTEQIHLEFSCLDGQGSLFMWKPKLQEKVQVAA